MQQNVDPMEKYRKPRSVGTQINMSKIVEPTPKTPPATDKKGEQKEKKEETKSEAPSEPQKDGVEICKGRQLDPQTDVYILKLGKKKGTKHEVELELRTPKCPEMYEPSYNTTAVQVYEEEFEDYKSADAKKVGKKGAAKGKGKAKAAAGKGKKK